MIENMIGAYGEWAAQTMQDPPRLSFRQPVFSNVEAWRAVARARFRELLLGPGHAATPVPAVQHQMEFDGLSIEHLHVATAVRTSDRSAGVETGRSHEANCQA